jgi:hypothetical protein
LLAGATMPTVSPGRSAGGLMRATFGTEGISIRILNANLSHRVNEKR